MQEPLETPDSARDHAILDAATAAFLRYGYRKTSMDEVARAAGLSRQGLYLHFPTKELLFKASLLRVLEQTRVLGEAVLAQREQGLQECLVAFFTAIHGHTVGKASTEQISELIQAASQQLGGAVEAADRTLIDALAARLGQEGPPISLPDRSLTPLDLATQLFATSHGLKHSVQTLEAYQKGMEVAALLVCHALQPPTAGRTGSIQSAGT